MTPKVKFLQRLNEAFASSNTQYIIDSVADDIQWSIVGEITIQGKENFRAALEKMKAEEPLELAINNIITNGDSAAVDGTMRSNEGKTYAFCDIYKLSGSQNPTIEKMTSYVVELKQNK